MSTIDFDFIMNEIDSTNPSPSNINNKQMFTSNDIDNNNRYHSNIYQYFTQIPDHILQHISAPV